LHINKIKYEQSAISQWYSDEIHEIWKTISYLVKRS
jgi:hypothetical protein